MYHTKSEKRGSTKMRLCCRISCLTDVFSWLLSPQINHCSKLSKERQVGFLEIFTIIDFGGFLNALIQNPTYHLSVYFTVIAEFSITIL